jgi:hypothetical protein
MISLKRTDITQTFRVISAKQAQSIFEVFECSRADVQHIYYGAGYIEMTYRKGTGHVEVAFNIDRDGKITNYRLVGKTRDVTEFATPRHLRIYKSTPETNKEFGFGETKDIWIGFRNGSMHLFGKSSGQFVRIRSTEVKDHKAPSKTSMLLDLSEIKRPKA